MNIIITFHNKGELATSMSGLTKDSLSASASTGEIDSSALLALERLEQIDKVSTQCIMFLFGGFLRSILMVSHSEL